MVANAGIGRGPEAEGRVVEDYFTCRGDLDVDLDVEGDGDGEDDGGGDEQGQGPEKPGLRVLEVNLSGVVYGKWKFSFHHSLEGGR